MDACVHIVEYKWAMRGASQPALITASDGFLYVVKFVANPQGPNLLFNEAVGTELFARMGLPVPPWRIVRATRNRLRQPPSRRLDCGAGPRGDSGWCFGSRFIDPRHSSLSEILTRSRFARIGNRGDFWTAWVLDVLAEHADNRQAVFFEDGSRRLVGHFIDQGQLFGGANGNLTPKTLAPRYLDPRMYCEVSEMNRRRILSAIDALDLSGLAAFAASLPEEWITRSAQARFTRFCDRLASRALVASTMDRIVELVESSRARDLPYAGQSVAALAINAPRKAGMVARLPGARRGPQPVRPCFANAANF